jgi:hypothetical protein
MAAWPVRQLVALAIGGSVGFALLLAALHFLRPDVNPLAQPGSAYALGPFGWVMAIAFFSLGLGGWALVLVIARSLPSAASSRIGLVLMGVWATSVWLAMLFPMDAPGWVPTFAGVIHDLSGIIGFLSWIAGALLVSRRLWVLDTWRPVKPALMALCVLMPAGYLGTALSFATGQPFTGLVQRLFLGTIIVWVVLVAGRLRASAAEAAQQ